MIEFLLEEKANPYITSLVSENEEETILETACRWNYTKIIRLYLSNFKWNTKTLKKALKLCTSNEAKNEINGAYKNTEGDSTFSCICCENKRVKTLPIIRMQQS